MAYAVGQGGCLTRCDATAFPRGGLMGLSDRCTGAIPRIDTLCRTIVAECVKRGFQGVLADFETIRILTGFRFSRVSPPA